MDNLEHRCAFATAVPSRRGKPFSGCFVHRMRLGSIRSRTAAGSAQPSSRIAGDRIEPRWDELLTITIGPKDADIMGTTDKAIQAAVDFVVQRGGGTVHILPGTYRVRNAIYLSSRLRIKGSGPETILIKEPSTTTKFADDSDWYDQEITLADARGFRLGDGVCLRAKNPSTGGPIVIKRTLVARSGNRFKLDRALRENLWLSGSRPLPRSFP